MISKLIDINAVCDELEATAVIFDAFGCPESAASACGGSIQLKPIYSRETGESSMLPRFIYSITTGPVTYRFVIAASAEAIRDRIETFKKQCRRPVNSKTLIEMRRASAWKPTYPKRPRYNGAVAKRFLSDGEAENHEVYLDLFN